MAAIAEASGIDVTARASPYPGRIYTSTGSLEVLSSDRTAGHASSSFDLVTNRRNGALMPGACPGVAGRSAVQCERQEWEGHSHLRSR